MNQRFSFNQGWRFARGYWPKAVDPAYPTEALATWDPVTLPHTPRYEPYANGDNPTFQGQVMYRKHFPTPQCHGKLVFLEFEAVMGVTDVWLNGTKLHTKFADAAPDQDGTVHTNCGGYLPFVVELTPFLRDDGDNVLVVLADNRDAPQVPPGKPQVVLDFTYFGGIYRNVWLDVLEPVHITNALFEDLPRGGGVIFTYKPDGCTVHTHVRNTTGMDQALKLTVSLGDAAEESSSFVLPAHSARTVTQTLHPAQPVLWSLDRPHLYPLTCTLLQNGAVLHRYEEQVGLRQITCSRERGVCINGVRAPLLSGVNRHQDYPILGNAATPLLQRQDAILYKSAGFSVVRTAHYPMSVDFLAACDQLGILVIEATPGWQWYPSGDDQPFTTRVHQNIRQMVRRDRNRPCILAYETVLNETYHIPPGYTRRMEEIALEESADARVAAESDGYDPAANGIDALADFIYGFQDPLAKTSKALMFHREYGDIWLEAYGGKLSRRVTRGHCGSEYPCGPAENRRKANKLLFDFQDDVYTLANCFQFYQESPSFAGCAIWTGIDSRGMWSKISPCGIWDSWRLPKTSYYAMASQRPAARNAALEALGAETGPVLYLAPGEGDVYVYSNGDCVELEVFQGAQSLYRCRKVPMSDGLCTALPHPPFYFDQVPAGTIRAKALDSAGNLLATAQWSPPGPPHRMALEATSNTLPCGEIVRLHARVLDAEGQLCEAFEEPVTFTLEGCGEIVADGLTYPAANPAVAEAGIASAYFRAGSKPGPVTVYAKAGALEARWHGVVLPAAAEELPYQALPVAHRLRSQDDDWADTHPPLDAVPEPRHNLAQGCACTASSHPEDADRVMGPGRFWETMWIGDAIGQQPEYFQVDLGHICQVEDAMVHIGGQMGSDCTHYSYEIHTSVDGQAWTVQAKTRRTAWSNGILDEFQADQVRYLRVVFTQIDSGLLPALTKIEIYSPKGKEQPLCSH